MMEYSQKVPEPPSRSVSVRKVWDTIALATQLLVAAAPLANPLTCAVCTLGFCSHKLSVEGLDI